MEKNEDVGASIIIGMRLFAFLIGVYLLSSGFAELGMLGSGDILSQLSAGPVGLLKIFVGIIMVFSAIKPDIISVTLRWIFRT